MTECDRLIHWYGLEKVEKCQKSWKFIMEATKRRPVEERMNATGSVEGAWKATMDW